MKFSLTGVYGMSRDGYYEAFLPKLGKWFSFYQEKDFDKLAKYFAQEAFFTLSPSAAYELLVPEEFWLETISVTIPPQKPVSTWSPKRDFPTLASLCDHLPEKKVRAGKSLQTPVWEQGAKVDQIVQMLIQEEAHVILVGKNGVGKSSILKEVIRKMDRQQASVQDRDKKTFWRTSPSRLTSKAKYLGEWEEMVEEMVLEGETANAVIWIENLVMLAMRGGEGPEDSIAAFLQPFIRQKLCQFVGELRPTELEALRRMLPGFVAHFRLVEIEEMDQPTTLRVLSHYRQFASRQLELELESEATELSYVLTDRFWKGDRFPGKVLRFLQSCAQEAFVEQLEVIDTDGIIRNFSQQTGLPEELLRDDILINPDELQGFFLDRIKGQDPAIGIICSLIKVFKAGLNDPNKPVGTLIFAGPTGVGKTATARAISEYFFRMGQSHEPLIRLDMSEFQASGQIGRLIGAEGKLTTHIRQHPFSVVLLDEIEKANPLIFSTLLTMMDEGILMDELGRTTDYRNAIIIMTSNLGSARQKSLGFRADGGKDYESEIRSFFAPEFYNRIDRVVIFEPLGQETIQQIARRELGLIPKRAGLAQRDFQFDFSEALVHFMAQVGFDERYGARPLQREIERLVVPPLARLLLAHPEKRGEIIFLDYRDEKVQVEMS